MSAAWCIFNGAPVFIEQRTIDRIETLKKGSVRFPKNDHIPTFNPVAVTFGLDEVNACVRLEKDRRNKTVEKADWSKLSIS